jgi:hypothetical protein
MTASVIVWEIETIPDLRDLAAAKGLVSKREDEARAKMGEKFRRTFRFTDQRRRAVRRW